MKDWLLNRFDISQREYPFVVVCDLSKTKSIANLLYSNLPLVDLLEMDIMPFPESNIRVFLFKDNREKKQMLWLLKCLDPETEELTCQE